MDVKQLKVFCSIVDQKSFSKAAREVGLSQPTVSAHIKSLEADLGTKLLDRLGKEAVPTKTGQVLYRYAKRVLKNMADARGEISLLDGESYGELSIGAGHVPGTYLLPQVISAFKTLHPQPLIRLKIGYTDLILQGVLSGEFELGVIGYKVPEPRVHFVPLVDDELVMAVPADHPWKERSVVTVDEIKRQPYITRERGSGTRRLIDAALVDGGIDPRDFRVTAEMSDTEAVKNAIMQGMGVSIVSLRAIENEIVQGNMAMVRIEGIHLRRTFHLITHKSRSASGLQRTFNDFLIDQARSHLFSSPPNGMADA